MAWVRKKGLKYDDFQPHLYDDDDDDGDDDDDHDDDDADDGNVNLRIGQKFSALHSCMQLNVTGFELNNL